MSRTFPGPANREQARLRMGAQSQRNLGVVITKVMHARSDKSLQKLHHFTGNTQKDRPLFHEGETLSWSLS